MKKIALLLILTLVAATASAADWVDKTLRSMTLDEKIGQLLLPYVGSGGFRPQGSEEFQKLRDSLTKYHLGGYHVMTGDPAGVALLVNDLQRASKLPLLITADLEGGTGFIMRGATRLPLGLAIGAAGSEE
ncbi:MAG: glycoside hydrolase family 3 N-terminal domain-containing protein, partial [Thermoanaerobaculia bacterium]